MNPDARLSQYRHQVLLSFILSLAGFVVYVVMRPSFISTDIEERVGIVWLGLYTLYCLYLRSQVPTRDMVGAYKFPIIHWVLLGIALVYFNIVRPSEFQGLYPIINIGFVMFTIFSADAHWDFKKLTK